MSKIDDAFSLNEIQIKDKTKLLTKRFIDSITIYKTLVGGGNKREESHQEGKERICYHVE
jgi:nitroimidazol reductase NimA-like FMN-containing flavoprotein (pyridoxamine 5'-phosphate oxidase superfamily)